MTDQPDPLEAACAAWYGEQWWAAGPHHRPSEPMRAIVRRKMRAALAAADQARWQPDPLEAALQVILAQLDLCGHTEAGVRDTVRAALDAAEGARRLPEASAAAPAAASRNRGRERAMKYEAQLIEVDPLEAACRAICVRRGIDPDEQVDLGLTTLPRWLEYRDDIRAALDAAEVARWQPIETAKELSPGTLILVLYDDGHTILMDDPEDCNWKPYDGPKGPGWATPMRYMPVTLPPLPTATEDGSEPEQVC